MIRTTAATPKPRRGNIYRSRDSRRELLTVAVLHVRRKLGVAEVINDLGQKYTIRLDRLNPRHHWAFDGQVADKGKWQVPYHIKNAFTKAR